MKQGVLYVDGASRGNPGDASIGGSLLNAEGMEIGTVSETIGRKTNNEAEYRALIAGLQMARKSGIDEIEVRADSQLMVRQMAGEYRVKHPNLKPLFAQARELVRGFRKFSIQHIPREENVRADELANEALNAARSRD